MRKNPSWMAFLKHSSIRPKNICQVLLFWFSVGFCAFTKIKVALHAQVSPNEKIVGSVITTDGLKAAFERRYDVQSTVKVFYPYAYAGFFDTKWDLIVIEGWFVSIHEFIAMTRNHSPLVRILFFCLDPSYPGLDYVLKFDVDGYMTNSKQLVNVLSSVAPTEFVQLAADERSMRSQNISKIKEYSAVYVGAGGSMLSYKPKLLKMLNDASRSRNLAIFGSNWRDTQMSKYWKGVLPRSEICDAYSNASVVIASTIESQALHGMINNRIFEALSCGSIIVTEFSGVLSSLTEGLIIFPFENDDINDVIRSVELHREKYNQIRIRSRQFILEKHTWSHRVIQILDLYNDINVYYNYFSTSSYYPFPAITQKKNAPKMAWIVSDSIRQHFDYLIGLEIGIFREFQRQYSITKFSCKEWLDLVYNDDISFLAQFDVIFAIVLPFDNLQNSFNDIPRMVKVHEKNYFQKRSLYLFGVDDHKLNKYLSELSSTNTSTHTSVYTCNFDVVFFRSYFDIEILKNIGFRFDAQRLQHLFGFPWNFMNGKGNSKDSVDTFLESVPVIIDETLAVSVLVVCFIKYDHLCSHEHRERLLGKDKPYVLLLLGGSWEDWLSVPTFLSTDNEIDLILPFTTFVGTNRKGNMQNIFSVADNVYIMHGRSSVPNNTISDVLLPFISASARSSQIYLETKNDHLLSLKDGNLWGLDYVQESTRQGIIRLTGFVNSQGKISAQLVTDCLSERCCPSHHRSNFYLIKLNFENFVPGKDGNCCLVFNSESVTCITWPFVYFGVTLLSSILNSSETLDLVFQIRGNMVSNVFSSSVVTIPRPIFNSDMQSDYGCQDTTFSTDVYSIQLMV